jgi:hypothetical protein
VLGVGRGREKLVARLHSSAASWPDGELVAYCGGQKCLVVVGQAEEVPGCYDCMTQTLLLWPNNAKTLRTRILCVRVVYVCAHKQHLVEIDIDIDIDIHSSMAADRVA